MARKKYKAFSEEGKKKLQKSWRDPKKRKAHGDKQRKLQAELAAKRKKIGLKRHSKLDPHPENQGGRYEAWPIAVHNFFDWQAGNWSVQVDHDWIPVEGETFTPTDLAPGSIGKIMEMRKRLELGHPLYHVNDRVDMHNYDVTMPGAMSLMDMRDGKVSIALLLKKSILEVEKCQK